jgi:hypothetical protein
MYPSATERAIPARRDSPTIHLGRSRPRGARGGRRPAARPTIHLGRSRPFGVSCPGIDRSRSSSRGLRAMRRTAERHRPTRIAKRRRRVEPPTVQNAIGDERAQPTPRPAPTGGESPRSFRPTGGLRTGGPAGPVGGRSGRAGATTAGSYARTARSGSPGARTGCRGAECPGGPLAVPIPSAPADRSPSRAALPGRSTRFKGGRGVGFARAALPRRQLA